MKYCESSGKAKHWKEMAFSVRSSSLKKTNWHPTSLGKRREHFRIFSNVNLETKEKHLPLILLYYCYNPVLRTPHLNFVGLSNKSKAEKEGKGGFLSFKQKVYLHFLTHEKDCSNNTVLGQIIFLF